MLPLTILPGADSSSSFPTPSVLHHLPDTGSQQVGPVLQLPHVSLHHLRAVPHHHRWTRQLRRGPAVYVQCRLLCLCHHCYLANAQLAYCHDGGHPLAGGQRARRTLAGTGKKQASTICPRAFLKINFPCILSFLISQKQNCTLFQERTVVCMPVLPSAS